MVAQEEDLRTLRAVAEERTRALGIKGTEEKKAQVELLGKLDEGIEEENFSLLLDVIVDLNKVNERVMASMLSTLFAWKNYAIALQNVLASDKN